MKAVVDLLTKLLSQGFVDAGYDQSYGNVSLSSRQDLCQYQCSGGLAAARAYKKSPMDIVGEVLDHLGDDFEFSIVKPGFININLNSDFIEDYLNNMMNDDHLAYTNYENKKMVIVDYGGPNVAKPLHVGHLRAAIIGESIKRINRFVGNHVIGDVHLGDWGLQIGIVIYELKCRQADLPYFNQEKDFPKTPPFTIDELSDIYPLGSKKSKEDPEYLDAARHITAQLQEGHPGYTALWQHISSVSIADLKSNYGKLNVEFDLWKGESHSMPAVAVVLDILQSKSLTKEDKGALIVEVEEAEDQRPMPPFIALKSDGAALYSTTDLATIYQRVEAYDPDEIIYVVDKRQELHFEQVFRCARKSEIVSDKTELNFIGFGTMNGKDGKPFKTREGGIMKLEDLIHMLRESVKVKVIHGREAYDEKMVDEIASKVGLAALKYGDLINQSVKNYVFDLDRFSNFEGKTGPYIQYSIVRMKSILKKAGSFNGKIVNAKTDTELSIQLKVMEFNQMIHKAYLDKSPNKICEYAFDLSNLFNRFYHESKILTEENTHIKEGWLTLLDLMVEVLETCLDLLGISSLDQM